MFLVRFLQILKRVSRCCKFVDFSLSMVALFLWDITEDQVVKVLNVIKKLKQSSFISRIKKVCLF